MTDEYLFISDCHLQAARADVSAALIEFLDKRATAARYLYILGDLFEVWLGDDDPADGLEPVIQALGRLAQNVELFFICGNRDFLLGEAFAARVGFSLLAEPIMLELDGKRVALVHGDSLCTDDHDYQAFRAMVRDPGWQSEFLARPLPERRQIAAQLRSDSADAMAAKPMDIMDVNTDAVQNCFRESKVDTLVHGHTHRPAVHRYPGNLTRYVLGDWNPGPSYLSWSKARGFALIDPRVQLPPADTESI